VASVVGGVYFKLELKVTELCFVLRSVAMKSADKMPSWLCHSCMRVPENFWSYLAIQSTSLPWHLLCGDVSVCVSVCHVDVLCPND